jgi:hypothetical protein
MGKFVSATLTRSAPVVLAEGSMSPGCAFCGATYADYDAVARHLADVHRAPGRVSHSAASWECPACGEQFAAPHEARWHLRSSHMLEAPEMLATP